MARILIVQDNMYSLLYKLPIERLLKVRETHRKQDMMVQNLIYFFSSGSKWLQDLWFLKS